MIMYNHKKNPLTITKVLDVRKEDRANENHLQLPEKAWQKTNIRTIQSQKPIESTTWCVR
jgi:hypothetical protein